MCRRTRSKIQSKNNKERPLHLVSASLHCEQSVVDLPTRPTCLQSWIFIVVGVCTNLANAKDKKKFSCEVMFMRTVLPRALSWNMKSKKCVDCSALKMKWINNHNLAHNLKDVVDQLSNICSTLSRKSVRLLEFSRNCAKLATLLTKAYTRKSKINPAKKLAPVGIENRTSLSLL